MIIDVLAAFFIGIMCGMGIGGGGLLVIYLTLIKGIPQLTAQGINLAFFIFASASALLIHAAGRKLLFSYIIFSLIFALPGAAAGSFVSSVISPSAVRKMFGVMLIFAGGITIFRQAAGFIKKRRRKNRGF